MKSLHIKLVNRSPKQDFDLMGFSQRIRFKLFQDAIETRIHSISVSIIVNQSFKILENDYLHAVRFSATPWSATLAMLCVNMPTALSMRAFLSAPVPRDAAAFSCSIAFVTHASS